MMLAHPILSKSLDFVEDRISVLVVEDQSVLTNLLLELIAQINGDDGRFLLSEDYKPIPIAKKLELVVDPLRIDFGQRKILNKIYADLTALASGENMIERTADLQNRLVAYLQSLLLSVSLPLTCVAEIDLGALLKAAGVAVDVLSSTLVERISEYLHILTDLSLVDCFVFVNLKSYLNDDDLKAFYREVAYKKYRVLLIENYFRDTLRLYEKTVVLDSDLCEVINEY